MAMSGWRVIFEEGTEAVTTKSRDSVFISPEKNIISILLWSLYQLYRLDTITEKLTQTGLNNIDIHKKRHDIHEKLRSIFYLIKQFKNVPKNSVTLSPSSLSLQHKLQPEEGGTYDHTMMAVSSWTQIVLY